MNLFTSKQKYKTVKTATKVEVKENNNLKALETENVELQFKLKEKEELIAKLTQENKILKIQKEIDTSDIVQIKAEYYKLLKRFELLNKN